MAGRGRSSAWRLRKSVAEMAHQKSGPGRAAIDGKDAREPKDGRKNWPFSVHGKQKSVIGEHPCGACRRSAYNVDMTVKPERDRERDWELEDNVRLRNLHSRGARPILDPLEE